jgi:hypothetical protein
VVYSVVVDKSFASKETIDARIATLAADMARKLRRNPG